MDQAKIGQFIQARRKEKGLTQNDLASIFNITDRAVSKWERGLSLPDASIMVRLSEILGISVNELLSGERIEKDADYIRSAEENLLKMKRKEEEANKYLLRLETVIGILSTVSFLTIIFTAAFLTPGTALMFLLMFLALAIFAVGIYSALKIERDAGYYECRHCHHSYVPDFSSVLMAPHIGRIRLMKCPSCGKRTWQKKVLSR